MAPKRKAATSTAAPTKKSKKDDLDQKAAAAASAKLYFSVEHWAAELCRLLEEKCPGASVELNPAKPRKGCFEISDQKGTKKFVSLLNMPRPFKALRELDLDKVAEDMAASLKESSSSEAGKAVPERAADSATPKQAAEVTAAAAAAEQE